MWWPTRRRGCRGMQPVTNGIRRYNNEIKDEKLDSVDGTAKRN